MISEFVTVAGVPGQISNLALCLDTDQTTGHAGLFHIFFVIRGKRARPLKIYRHRPAHLEPVAKRRALIERGAAAGELRSQSDVSDRRRTGKGRGNAQRRRRHE